MAEREGNPEATEKVQRKGIPEGMLQVIYAMANESGREGRYLYDPMAPELVKRLEGGFQGVNQEALGPVRDSVMGRGALARAILLDRMTADYVRRHPQGRIVNLGCGMDTRFYRVDNGRIRWYDVDLPEVMEARRQLLPEDDRVVLIGGSVLDSVWAEKVEAGPVLILAQRLSMFLDKQKLQKIFKIIRTCFEEAEVYMEIASLYTVKNSYENVDGESRLKYSWGAGSAKELAAITTGFKAVRDVSLMEGLKEMYPSYHVLRFFPPLRRMSNKIAVLRREP